MLHAFKQTPIDTHVCHMNTVHELFILHFQGSPGFPASDGAPGFEVHPVYVEVFPMLTAFEYF